MNAKPPLMCTLLICGACQDYNIVDPKQPVWGAQPDELVPSTVINHFEQRTAAASDILFVIDDSGSMGQEQDNLVNNFTHFAQFLFDSGVDYHIGIVRGGESSGPTPTGELVGFPPYIHPETEFGINVFTQTVAGLGTDGGSGCESGLEAAYQALTEPNLSTFNDGFYREEALLTVVVVTDEDDHGNDRDCERPTADPEVWADWVRDLKGDPDRINVGIIAGFDTVDNVTPVDCESDGLGFADAGSRYAHLLQVISGVSWSICNDDWSAVLTELGLGAAGLSLQFNLTRVPEWDITDADGDNIIDEPRLELLIDRLDGAGLVNVEPIWSATPDATNPWDYDRARNAVLFTVNTIPEEGWQLQAVYPNSEG